MNRRVFLAVVAVLALPLPAQSTELTPFSADAFEKAQVFKGSKEVARAVGETRPDALRELLSMAL